MRFFLMKVSAYDVWRRCKLLFILDQLYHIGDEKNKRSSPYLIKLQIA